MTTDLRCPQCDEPVPPDRGIRARGGIGTPYTIGWGPWRQHARCPNCGTSLQRNPDLPNDQWVAPALLNLGPAKVRASGHLEINITPAVEADTATPITPLKAIPQEVSIGLGEVHWLIASTSFGALVGELLADEPGAVIGAIVGFVWGRWKWKQVEG
jgi:hypothetical protein